MSLKNNTLGLFVILLVAEGVGIAWEGLWWQEIIDAYSIFGDPPQLLYHTSILIMLLIALRESQKPHQKIWGIISILLILLLINIPLTYYVNSIFGVPSRYGLIIYWGAPYIFTSIFSIGICIFLLKIIKQKSYNKWNPLLQYAIYASILMHLLIRLRPFRPTSTVHDVIGFWGPGVIIAAFIFVLLFAKKTIDSKYSATKTTFVTLSLYSLIGLLGIWTFSIAKISAEIWQNMLLGGFTHPPTVLSSLSLIVCALIIDMKTFSARIKVLIASVVQAGLLYGAANFFIAPVASYGKLEFLTAVISAAIGGLMAYQLFILSTKKV
ncbi:MAG: hypothetical protein K9M03_00500 [Kiritimatiellales bacterium]|nr:hypothetical protein [Kiritimatiellales bacterium]